MVWLGNTFYVGVNMYVLENVKRVVRGSEVIIEVGKPKIENGKVVDIPPKEAFKIGDKEERRELINNFYHN